MTGTDWVLVACGFFVGLLFNAPILLLIARQVGRANATARFHREIIDTHGRELDLILKLVVGEVGERKNGRDEPQSTQHH